MKNLISEVSFAALKDNFDAVCDSVNGCGEPVAIRLSSGRKAFILPEQSYDNITRFIVRNVRPGSLTT